MSPLGAIRETEICTCPLLVPLARTTRFVLAVKLVLGIEAHSIVALAVEVGMQVMNSSASQTPRILVTQIGHPISEVAP